MADGNQHSAAWFSAAELAGLPGMPGTDRGVLKMATRESWANRRRVKGKGLEYALDSLPAATQAALIVRSRPAATPRAEQKLNTQASIDAAWKRYEAAGQVLQQRGQRCATAVDAVNRLVANGMGLMDARAQVASALQSEDEELPGSSSASLGRWAAKVTGAARTDWPALLLPAYAGGNNVADCDPQCWDWYKGHYLTRARPTHASTYRRLKEMADAQGWTIPSAKTLQRRMDAEVSHTTQVMLRDGAQAAARLLPTMQRDALSFAVGEAVNGDGLKFDSKHVQFEDGEIINTATAWFWQDIHSRRILAWRLDKTENTDVFRLATYDLTGICAPTDVWVDNTRVAANKLMTAGAKGRHRYKSDPEDGLGLLLMLGMDPHFTNPDKESGNPGAKPIERAFGIGGIHSEVATHPKLIDRGFSKATAIPVALLREVIAEEVKRFNERTQRRTQACRGVLSFSQAWEIGTQERPPRVLTDAQRRILLMSREVVTAARPNGELRIQAGRGPYGQNAYWSEHLANYIGKKVAVHFDPADLTANVHVYSLDGRYLFAAEHIERGAFKDTQKGREWGKFRRRVAKANKEVAQNEARMNALERETLYRASVPASTDPSPSTADSNVVQGHFKSLPNPERDALRATGTDDAREAAFADLMADMQVKHLARRPVLVRSDDE